MSVPLRNLALISTVLNEYKLKAGAYRKHRVSGHVDPEADGLLESGDE